MAECPFCGIASGNSDTELLAESDHSVAFHDRYPVGAGHALVVPRNHVADLFDLDPTERADTWALVDTVHDLLMERFDPDGFNIGVNMSAAAGQTVSHSHIHLIPRYHGDVKDPRGGIRWVIPDKAVYWEDTAKSAEPGLPEGFWSVFETGLNRALVARTPKSEDLVRYVFFQSLVASGVEVHRFAFEYPHPAIKRAMVDTVLVDERDDPCVALEVKYHRSNSSGNNLPRPQMAGMLVHDMVRLAAFTPAETQRVLLYVTDKEMASYFGNPSNGLSWVTGLKPGDSKTLNDGDFTQLSKTFRKAVGPWPGPVIVRTLHSADLKAGHTARLYQIESAEAVPLVEGGH